MNLNRYTLARRALAAAAGVLAFGLLTGAPAAQAAGGSGRIDASFGQHGTAVVNLGLDAAGRGRLGTPVAALVLGSGDILVGGGRGVVRLLPTGQLDRSFGSGGYAPVSFAAGGLGGPGLTVQPDGKILWAGSIARPNAPSGTNITDFAVERFTASGAPDRTFGHGGVVTTDFPTAGLGGESAQAVLVQPDGKIVAGGFAGTFGKNGHDNAALVRYTPNGSLDTSFGTGGKVTSGPGNVETIGLDTAGDIFTLPGETEYTPAGHKDAHVTAAPITASTSGLMDLSGVIGTFTFLPTGQTLAGGSVGTASDRFDTDAQVQRLNAAGTVDPAFASPPIDFDSREGGRSDSTVMSLAVQPDGKVLIGGNTGLARVNQNGTLDTGFGNGGVEPRVASTLPGVLSTSALLAILPHAKFLAIGAGANPTTGAVELILTRYFQ